MPHFCTITTSDHLYKTLALFDSLREYNDQTHLHVLCIDEDFRVLGNDYLHYYKKSHISDDRSAKDILKKYSANLDKLRWSLKPVFLAYLLNSEIDKVVYVDNDIYFFSEYDFLFDLLDQHNFLLTPHYYSSDPTKDQNWFEANFRVGLYNAGFVGVSKDAVKYLDWWSSCCAYRCEKNALRGMFDDQKYLDLMPIINPGAHIVRHKGCNVADWNRSEISREVKNGQVILDGNFSLVFIHFNYTTIGSIHWGAEPALAECFEKYYLNLKKYYPFVERKNMYGKGKYLDRVKFRIWKFFTDRNL